jgi:secreted trypsin-like serine protease
VGTPRIITSRLLFFLVLGVSSLALARAQPAGAIIGGSPAPTGTWPWVAFISVPASDGVDSCSGSVVAPSVILTAAHCVVDESTDTIYQPSQLTVTTGRIDIADASTGQVLAVSKVAVYPTFHLGTLRGDVALLQLSSPTGAPGLPIARPGDALVAYAAGDATITAGWGVEDPSMGVEPTRLNTVALAVRSDAHCAAELGLVRPWGYDPSTMYCAAEPGLEVGTCSGDSGGPAIRVRASGRAVEVGVVSWNQAGCVHPDVFARVASLAHWLTPEITLLESTAPTTTAVPPQSPSLPAATPAPPLPRLRTGASTGVAGDVAKLKFWVSDEAKQRLRVHAEIFDGGEIIYSTTTRYFRPESGVSTVRWRVPRRLAHRVRFCMYAFSTTGESSTRVCSQLRVRHAADRWSQAGSNR